MNYRRFIPALFIIFIGVSWIANVYGLFPWLETVRIEFGKVWIPVLILFVGLKMLYSAISPSRRYECRHRGFDEVSPSGECSVSFGARSMNFAGMKFEGITIRAFCGGVRIDLRGADVVDGSTIEVNTTMGGVEIFLPDDVAVEVDNSCILGGVGDDRRNVRNLQNASKTLLLSASCMLGGVSLK